MTVWAYGPPIVVVVNVGTEGTEIFGLHPIESIMKMTATAMKNRNAQGSNLAFLGRPLPLFLSIRIREKNAYAGLGIGIEMCPDRKK
jgi:hypothetical protein